MRPHASREHERPVPPVVRAGAERSPRGEWQTREKRIADTIGKFGHRSQRQQERDRRDPRVARGILPYPVAIRENEERRRKTGGPDLGPAPPALPQEQEEREHDRRHQSHLLAPEPTARRQ